MDKPKLSLDVFMSKLHVAAQYRFKLVFIPAQFVHPYTQVDYKLWVICLISIKCNQLVQVSSC